MGKKRRNDAGDDEEEWGAGARACGGQTVATPGAPPADDTPPHRRQSVGPSAETHTATRYTQVKVLYAFIFTSEIRNIETAIALYVRCF